MSFKYTDQQVCAFTAKGDSLLVSAAAGSGKTAVLVERVLKYLIEEQGDIRRLLITTYTEAAAAEMRQKIKKRVDEALRAEPSDHLMRQSALIESAEIGTVHSICLRLITRYFDRLDLDPRMRLMDPADELELKDRQAEALMEELYTSADSGVVRLLECYAAGRSDEELKEFLISGADFLENQPLPKQYIERALAPYRSESGNLFDRFSEDGLYQYLQSRLEGLRIKLRFIFLKWLPLLNAETEAKAKDFCAEQIDLFDGFLALLKRRDYKQFSDAGTALKFGTVQWKRWFTADGDALEPLRSDWSKFKDSVKEIVAEISIPQEEQIRRIEEQGDRLATYFNLCMELRARLHQARKSGGWITFGDMERLAVELLVESYDPQTDRMIPKEIALRLREEFDEIIVDEFQDTNRNQDLIFRALSKEGKNLFMVGDMKQSIYRFRGAEPEIFNQKRKAAVGVEGNTLTVPSVLELNANFRSHRGVLDFANAVFRGIMSEQVGGVDYDEKEWLYPHRSYAEDQATRAEIHWILRQDRDERGRKVSVAKQNACYTAALIQKAVQSKETLLLPDGVTRPVEYKDFCILLHTASRTAEHYEQALTDLGIPVMNRNEGVQFFALAEVQSLLSYLMVLDNPYNDIALVSLLLGDYFRFSLGQIAALRNKKAPLYDNLRQAAQTDAAAKTAFDTIEGYRSLAGTLYVYDLLHRILQESGVMDAYAAKGQTSKCANLELLAEDARAFEKEGYRGLYAFIQHIRIAKSSAQGGARLQSDENSVKIMTIHKSKGLEFPICILGDGQVTFNRTDLQKSVLFHPRYGAAVEQIEPEAFYRDKSLCQRVLADQMAADLISEEERVLYVALTRPQSKTIVLANEPLKKVALWAQEGALLEQPLPRWLLTEENATYDRWLITLLAGAAEGEPLRQCFGLREGNYPALYAQFKFAEEEQAEGNAAGEGACPPKFDAAALRARLEWQYPHLAAVGMPAKLSVSELKGLRQPEEDAAPLLNEGYRSAPPRFMGKVRGNERGNALHQALQFADFEALQKDVGKELDRLAAERFITAAQREMIEEQTVLHFTQSECFKELLTADAYSKEERFIFPLTAKEIFGEGEGEILIQGVLDCYWIRNGKATILDYKTDCVTDPQTLIDRYAGQMELYEQALKRVKGLEVCRKVIYSFALEQEIEI